MSAPPRIPPPARLQHRRSSQIRRGGGARTRHAALVLAGVLAFAAIDRVLSLLFDSWGLRFPSFVAGMLVCFMGLGLLRRVSPKHAASLIHFATPAGHVLSRWMALFFVPPLVLLPLTAAPRNSELLQLVLVLGLGFLLTLISTAWLARALGAPDELAAPPSAATSLPWSSASLLGLWGASTLGSFVVSRFPGSKWATICFGVALSVLSFVLAELARERLLRHAPRLGMLCHPVFVSALLIGFIWRASGFDLSDYLRPSAAFESAGAVLASLLRPSVVALGLALDAQRRLLRTAVLPLLVAATFGASLSLFATAFAAGRLGLAEVYALALVPRSVTTPVALAIADALGANPGLSAVFVILTGLLGALFAVPVLVRLGLATTTMLGVATGVASHGIGTAALAREYPVAAAISGISFALTAVVSSALVSIDAVRNTLLALARG